MGILKGIIDRFRAMGKTENEISDIIETAANKATANPEMHGLPMRRKQKARKKHERGKGADCH